MNSFKNIIMIVVIILFLCSCLGYGEKDDTQEAVENGAQLGLLLYFFQVLLPTKVIDMEDGTVKSLVSISDSDNYFYFKKCLQGQVYRESENDCKGTGSEDDNYGAVQLQYCDTADNSCNGGENEDVLDGSGNSEAYDSCNSDTFLNKDWKVPYFFGYIFDSPYYETIYNTIATKELKIWLSQSSRINSEFAKCKNCDECKNCNDYTDYGGTYGKKTNRYYVLCSANE